MLDTSNGLVGATRVLARADTDAILVDARREAMMGSRAPQPRGRPSGRRRRDRGALADIDEINVGNQVAAQKLSADVTALGNPPASAGVAADEDLLRGISVQIAVAAPALGVVKTLPDSDVTQAFGRKFTDPETGIPAVSENELAKEATS
jgi:hypothetical protein